MFALNTLLLLVALAASALAGTAGMGIGSILTPFLAPQLGMELAICATTIPHLVACLIRFRNVRSRVNYRILLRFGCMSAIGSLTGAILQTAVNNPQLTSIFGLLLISMVLLGFTRLARTAQRLFGNAAGFWFAAFFSGTFVGLVGHQGGIRHAALSTSQLPAKSLAATSTAIAILIDLVRIPIYLVHEKTQILFASTQILWSTLGAVIGTYLAMRYSKHLSRAPIRRALGVGLFTVGLRLFTKAWWP